MKKRMLIALVVVLALAATASLVWADKPIGFDAHGNETAWANSGSSCMKIQSGTITDVADNPITVGYDQFGYNYQAHLFSGRYCDYDREIGGDYCDVHLIMKWSDEWLSNVDCNFDGKLDRGYSCNPDNPNSSACEGSWLTNHQRGTNPDGSHWTYFVKIVYPPGGSEDVDPADGIDDNTGGEIIWGAYIIIQQVSNDPAYDEHGILTLVKPAGFGAYK